MYIGNLVTVEHEVEHYDAAAAAPLYQPKGRLCANSNLSVNPICLFRRFCEEFPYLVLVDAFDFDSF